MQWNQRKGKEGLTGFGKCRAVLPYKLLARGDPSPLCAALFLARDSRSCPNTGSPVTAQSSVEDHAVVLEELERVAIAGRPERARRPPSIRYWCRGGDIGRDVLPGEEPDGNTRVVPEHCQWAQISIKATPKVRSRVKN